MVLVDSSVWIEHLRRPVPALLRLLEARRVATHPFVVGELACGRIEPRAALLADLQKLRTVPRATDDEALALIENHSLMGRGIGYVDVHLLASTMLAAHTRLWSIDRRLASAAAGLSVSWAP